MFLPACVKNSVHSEGGMHGRGVHGGGVHGRRLCVTEGYAWQGGGVAEGLCMQERRPLKWVVCILLECILDS